MVVCIRLYVSDYSVQVIFTYSTDIVFYDVQNECGFYVHCGVYIYILRVLRLLSTVIRLKVLSHCMAPYGTVHDPV